MKHVSDRVLFWAGGALIALSLACAAVVTLGNGAGCRPVSPHLGSAYRFAWLRLFCGSGNSAYLCRPQQECQPFHLCAQADRLYLFMVFDYSGDAALFFVTRQSPEPADYRFRALFQIHGERKIL